MNVGPVLWTSEPSPTPVLNLTPFWRHCLQAVMFGAAAVLLAALFLV
jgi:hypothetical protein